MAKSLTRIQAVIGCILCIAGILWFWNSESLILFGSRTQGTVTQNIAKGRGYAANILFYSAPEHPQYFVTTSSHNPPLYALGEQVPVYFDSEHPERATTDSFFDSLFGPLMLVVAGITNLLLVGIRHHQRASFGKGRI